MLHCGDPGYNCHHDSHLDLVTVILSVKHFVKNNLHILFGMFSSDMAEFGSLINSNQGKKQRLFG